MQDLTWMNLEIYMWVVELVYIAEAILLQENYND